MEISQVSGARSLANGLRFVVHVDDLDLAILNDDIDRPLALLLPEVDACKARARINKLGKQLASLVRLKVARCVQAYKRKSFEAVAFKQALEHLNHIRRKEVPIDVEALEASLALDEVQLEGHQSGLFPP